MLVTRKEAKITTVLAGSVPKGKTFKIGDCDFLVMGDNTSIKVIPKHAENFVVVYNINTETIGVIEKDREVYRTKASLVIRG